MMQTSTRQKLTLLILLLLAVLAIAPDNSESRRLDYHEILVAQTASEMLERNDFLVPYFLDNPRLKKPPLSYWLSAAAHRVFGEAGSTHVNEIEARLPSLVSAALLVLVTFGLGSLVTRDPRGGLIAAGILASSPAFFTFGRSARPEMLYALLCALMVFGFLLLLRRAEEGRSTRGAAALTWIAFALSLLAKGPQFPLFFLIGIALTLLLRERHTLLLRNLHPWMVLPALLVPLAYYAYLAVEVEGAAALWGSEMVQGDNVPLWLRPLRLYYPIVLILSLAPWLIALAATIVDAWRHRDRDVLILINCVLVSLVLISFAGKLRAHYVLPLLPVCAALIAATLLRAFDSSRAEAPRGRRFWFLLWGQYGLVGVIVAGVIIHYVIYEMEAGDVSSVPLVILFLGLAGAFYVTAGVQIRRNLARAFTLLLVASLLAVGALPWMSFGKSGGGESAYRFIRAVEEILPPQGVLYFDFGKHLLAYERYYGSGVMQRYSLEDWIKSAENGPAPFFVSSYGRVVESGIAGEFVFKEQTEERRRDRAKVLFQPAMPVSTD